MEMAFRLYRRRRETAIQGEYFVGGASLPHLFLPDEARSPRLKLASSTEYHEIMDIHETPVMVRIVLL